MVKRTSQMLALGTKAPDFSLEEVTGGGTVGLADLVGDSKPLLVMFICAHCPFVKHVEHELAAIGKDYAELVNIVAISSNDVDNYPEDAPEELATQAHRNGFEFPYLYDKTQEVAKSYSAECTPDFFLFDSQHELAYRGQLDPSRPGNDLPCDGSDLRAAMVALIEGRKPAVDQMPSVGCSIKWRPGNEPSYFG